MNYAEHRNIPRQRIGLQMGGTRGVGANASSVTSSSGMSGAQLDAFWSQPGGVNSQPFATVAMYYADAQQAQATGYKFSQASLTNLGHWTTYAAATGNPVTVNTGTAFADIRTSAGPLSTLAGLPIVGPLISKFTGGAAPAAPVVAPATSFLSTTTVLIISAVGAATYILLKPKKVGG